MPTTARRTRNARIHTDYVHEQQSRYCTAIADLEQRMNGASTSELVKLDKQLSKLQDQTNETREYEEKIHHLADQMIRIELGIGIFIHQATRFPAQLPRRFCH